MPNGGKKLFPGPRSTLPTPSFCQPTPQKSKPWEWLWRLMDLKTNNSHLSTQIATTWGLSVRGGSSLYLTSTAPFLSKWSPALLWNISWKFNISLWVVFTYKQFNILVQERSIVFNLTGDIQARQTLWEINSFNAVAQIGFQVTWILLWIRSGLFQNRKFLEILKMIF